MPRRGRDSLRAALEHVRIGDLHCPASLRRRECPAAHVARDAALHGLATHRALLDERVGDLAGRVDDEDDGHLPVQPVVLGELFLVAVLHLVVVPPDDPVDHVAGETTDDDRAPWHELRLFLPSPTELDVARAAGSSARSFGTQPTDAERGSAAALARAARPEAADAVGIARARRASHSAHGVVDPDAQPAGAEHVGGGAGSRAHLGQRGDEAELHDLLSVRLTLVGFDRRSTLARRRCLLLLDLALAELALLLARLGAFRHS